MATVRIVKRAINVMIAASIASLSMSLVACGGSSDDASLFSPAGDAGTEASSIPVLDAGHFAVDANNDVSTVAPTCTPTKAGFTAQWVPPTPFKQGVCSTAQIGAFFTACLASPIDPPTCAAYVAANGACSTCLQSQETDAAYGPVIWHANNKYYTTNVAGCISNAQGDTSTTGCAAAYQAVLQCNESACNACFASTNGSFANFVSCQQEAIKSVCQTFADDEGVKCSPVLHGDAGSAAVAACLPPKGASGEDAYKQLAPLFCGN